jgi:hypothetical protein
MWKTTLNITKNVIGGSDIRMTIMMKHLMGMVNMIRKEEEGGEKKKIYERENCWRVRLATHTATPIV